MTFTHSTTLTMQYWVLLIFIGSTALCFECDNYTRSAYSLAACWNLENFTIIKSDLTTYNLSFSEAKHLYMHIDICAFPDVDSYSKWRTVCPSDRNKNKSLCSASPISYFTINIICFKNTSSWVLSTTIYHGRPEKPVMSLNRGETGLLYLLLLRYIKWTESVAQLKRTYPIPPCRNVSTGNGLSVHACWNRSFVFKFDNHNYSFDYDVALKIYTLLDKCMFVSTSPDAPNYCPTRRNIDDDECTFTASHNTTVLCLDREYNVLSAKFGTDITNVRFTQLSWIYFTLRDYVLAYKVRQIS